MPARRDEHVLTSTASFTRGTLPRSLRIYMRPSASGGLFSMGVPASIRIGGRSALRGFAASAHT